MSESGAFYGILIDPILTGIRKRVAKYIEPGQTVVDVACGTGAQLIEVADKSKKALGFDFSASMIQRAQKRKIKNNLSHVEFFIQDATTPWPIKDYQFDIAIMSLALHQFSPENYSVILSEMKRVAMRQIFLDYNIPLPDNFMGTGSIIAELLAGKEHNRNFKFYSRQGGLRKILFEHDFNIKQEEFLAKNIFHLVTCN